MVHTTLYNLNTETSLNNQLKITNSAGFVPVCINSICESRKSPAGFRIPATQNVIELADTVPSFYGCCFDVSIWFVFRIFGISSPFSYCLDYFSKIYFRSAQNNFINYSEASRRASYSPGFLLTKVHWSNKIAYLFCQAVSCNGFSRDFACSLCRYKEMLQPLTCGSYDVSGCASLEPSPGN
jgi:hypothetical protein